VLAVVVEVAFAVVVVVLLAVVVAVVIILVSCACSRWCSCYGSRRSLVHRWCGICNRSSCTIDVVIVAVVCGRWCIIGVALGAIVIAVIAIKVRVFAKLAQCKWSGCNIFVKKNNWLLSSCGF